MNLTELEKLADAVSGQMPANLQKQRLAEETRKLIAVMRQMAEALSLLDYGTRFTGGVDALAAYDALMKGEEE